MMPCACSRGRDVSTIALLVFPVVVATGTDSALEATARITQCKDCTITATSVVSLGPADGPGAFASRPYSAALDARGRYYVVTPETVNETPLVFNSNGTFLRRLGRAGEGPGEYRAPSVILATRDDSIVIVDDRLARITVLSPDYSLVRTIPVPPNITSAAYLQDGSFIVNAPIRTSASIGLPLHRLSPDGRLINSFGAHTAVALPREVARIVRWFFVTDEEKVWVVPYAHEYAVELWETGGTRLKRFLRTPDWYRPYARYGTPTPERAPAPRLLGIWQDSLGYVWVIGHLPDPRWREALGSPITAEGQRYFPIRDQQLAYDGFVEVMDPDRGIPFAYRRLPQTLDLVVRPGIVGGVRERADGSLYLEIIRLGLANP